MAKSPSSTRRRQKRCPACARFFIVKNIGKIFRSSSGTGHERHLHRTAAGRSRTMSFAIMANTSRSPSRTLSRAPKPPRTRSSSAMRKRSRTSNTSSQPTMIQTVVETSYGPEKRVQSERGNAAAAFASAPVKLDQTYVTPAETHVPIELQGTTAMWDGDQPDHLRGVARHLQYARACSRKCSVCRTRTCASSPSSSARVSAANSGHGRIVRWRWRRRVS